MAVVKLGLGKEKNEKVPVPLTKPRALALQTELLDAFSTAKFQKKLNELARKHSKSEERSKAYSSFKSLVRKSQREIIPRYGFDASEEGVESMMKAFRQFKDDPDIYVNECAIKEALSLTLDDSTEQVVSQEVSGASLSESLLRERSGSDASNANGSSGSNGNGSVPTVRNLVVVWLRRLIVRFSTPTFQAFRAKTKSPGFGQEEKEKKVEKVEKVEKDFGTFAVESPPVASECGSLQDSQDRKDATELEKSQAKGRKFGCDFEAYYELLAKAEGKGSMQSRLEGVKMMIREACILDDVEVTQLFNTVNMKLGMAADACGPFRDSLRLHLIQAEESG